MNILFVLLTSKVSDTVKIKKIFHSAETLLPPPHKTWFQTLQGQRKQQSFKGSLFFFSPSNILLYVLNQYNISNVTNYCPIPEVPRVHTFTCTSNKKQQNWNTSFMQHVLLYAYFCTFVCLQQDDKCFLSSQDLKMHGLLKTN